MAKKQQGDAVKSAALALRPKEVGQLSFDPLYGKGATKKGLVFVDKYRAVLKKKYPGFDLSELDSLPELADRIAEQQRIVQKSSQAGSFTDLVPELTSWRRRLMSSAQALAETGAVDRKALAAIEKGSGPADLARDVADLVELLTPQRAKVEAFIGGTLSAAKAIADAAIAALGGGATNEKAIATARDLRDRYASLFVARHDRLRSAIAAVTSYREAETLVPPLFPGNPGKKPGAPPAEPPK